MNENKKTYFRCGKCNFESEMEISYCPECSKDVVSIDAAFSKIGGLFDNAKEIISSKSTELIDSNPKLKEHAKKISEGVSSAYVESGVKKHLETAITKSGEQLDVLSGQAMYELVQERLALQDRYNDLLATKLHEALERISELEKILSKSISSKISSEK